MQRCTAYYERRAARQGARLIAGVDEVGRGSLFGPVVAAAVILDLPRRPSGLNDSKLLTAAERERLAPLIRDCALAWTVSAVDAAQIDWLNIYQASRLAMERAVAQLAPSPDWLLVDAMGLAWPGAQEALIHGDARSVSVAAASILAKVHRDALLQRWDAVYPAYRLGANKGYATPSHLAALAAFGCTPLHRRSYWPVAERLLGAAPLLSFPTDGSLQL